MAYYQQQQNRPFQQDTKCKLFVGGLDKTTTQDAVAQYFAAYGEPKVNVVTNKETGQSKGFAFLTFSRADLVDQAQASRPHKIDGRALTTTRVLPKNDQGESDNTQVKKLFVARIRGTIEEANIREVFKDYGNVLSVAIPIDKETQKQKGFTFVEFDDCDSVDKAMVYREEIQVNGNAVDIKKAFDKTQQAGAGGGAPRGRGGGRGAPGGGMRGRGGGGFRGAATNGYHDSNGYGAARGRGAGARGGAGRGRGAATGYEAEAGYGYDASATAGYGYEASATAGYGYEATGYEATGYEASATAGYGYEASATDGYGYEATATAGYGYDASATAGYGYEASTAYSGASLYASPGAPRGGRGGYRGGAGAPRGGPRGRGGPAGERGGPARGRGGPAGGRGGPAGGRGGPGAMRGSRGRGGQRPQPYSTGY